MGHASLSESTRGNQLGIQAKETQLGGQHGEKVLAGKGDPCVCTENIKNRFIKSCWVPWKLSHCIQTSENTELCAIGRRCNRDSEFSLKTLNSLGHWEGYDDSIITHHKLSPRQVFDEGEGSLSVRYHISNSGEPKEKEVIKGSERAGSREGHCKSS